MNIQKFYKDEYEKLSNFQKMFGCDIKSIETSGDCHWNKLFHDRLLDFLTSREIVPAGTDIRLFHEVCDEKYLEYKTVGEYNNSRPLIADLVFEFIEQSELQYLKFVEWLYKEVIKKDFFFQKIPTIRFHAPNALGSVNLPAWHSDSFLGHNPREFNVWFGITDNEKSDIWIQDVKNSKKWFEELEFDRERWKKICFSGDKAFCERGYNNSLEFQNIFNSVIMFDSRCIHTANHRSKRDETTKFSIDMRLILVEDFEWVVIDGSPVFVGDGIKKAEYRPGSSHGYHDKSARELFG